MISQFAVEILGISLLASLLACGCLLPFGPLIARSAIIAPPTNLGITVGTPASQPLTIPFSGQSVLLILVASIVLAAATSCLPAWYVLHQRPAHALRRL